jgi:hypothetical protein
MVFPICASILSRSASVNPVWWPGTPKANPAPCPIFGTLTGKAGADELTVEFSGEFLIDDLAHGRDRGEPREPEHGVGGALAQVIAGVLGQLRVGDGRQRDDQSPGANLALELAQDDGILGCIRAARVGPAKRVPVVHLDVDRAWLVVIHVHDGRDPGGQLALEFLGIPSAPVQPRPRRLCPQGYAQVSARMYLA